MKIFSFSVNKYLVVILNSDVRYVYKYLVKNLYPLYLLHNGLKWKSGEILNGKFANKITFVM